MEKLPCGLTTALDGSEEIFLYMAFASNLANDIRCANGTVGTSAFSVAPLALNSVGGGGRGQLPVSNKNTSAVEVVWTAPTVGAHHA